MKRILLLFLVISLAVLFFTGCNMLTPDIKDVELKVTAFKQYVYCSAKNDVKIYTVLNGEKFKCGPYCPPCPDCDSCCPECEECEECEVCEECEICECPQCPQCPCYGITLGDLVVDFSVWNIGNTVVTVDEISLVITFEDGMTIKKYIDIGEILLIGEEKEKQVEINLPNPVKRVVFVEPESIGFN